jgi:uroporphyrinogen decarboxylase
VAERLREHYGLDDPFVALGMHVFAVGPRPASDFEPAARGVDEFGVTWHTTPFGARLPVGHPMPEPTMHGVNWPDAHAPGRFDHVGQIMAENQDRFMVAVVNHTLFERAWFLRGFREFLYDLALRPAFAHALLDRILEFDLAILERLLNYRVDGVWFGDDYSHQGGLIVSPAMWRRFIKPRLAVLMERARRGGLPVFLHSDGAVSDLIPDLLEIGLNALNPLQPEVMDLAWLKREYGRELCFCGGISTQHVLSHGTPDEVEAELRNKVALLAQGGGYIVATAGSVQSDVPLANLVQLIDLLRGQDSIPLNG